MRLLLAALVAVPLAACSSKVYVLRNPATGEVVRCERNSGSSFFPIIQTGMDNSAAEACAEGYERAGWVRS